MPELNENSNIPLYYQLYEYIKSFITSGEIVYNEKLPSLRNLSESLNVSITTIELAYSQLDVEGYIYSKPQSGYYISDVHSYQDGETSSNFTPSFTPPTIDSNHIIYDLNCFDFNKWKKCINKVFTQSPQLLLFESDPQGEIRLRHEVAKYVYTSRGVKCNPDQIVISAGTQQTTNHLSIILQKMNIDNISLETPGYLPVSHIFRDRNFTLSHIPVLNDGIDIDLLPCNIKSAVYVNPSNQFPTGAVMPIGKRYRLLNWATKNNSYIIEDDYNSELRYFGRPVPALQGLDMNQRVIYLGSFSSTLFASIKISYMILPQDMSKIFQKMRNDYSQTCSKTEQLALALFMEEGKYQTGIKKLRRLYSQKLNLIISLINKFGKNFVTPINTSSGINMILSVNSNKSPDSLSLEAKKLGLDISPIADYPNSINDIYMAFYYTHIPLDKIENIIEKLLTVWSTN